MVRKEELTYKSRDRQTMLHAIRWIPEGEPIAILQIIHGMQEYVDRYDEFANYLAERGILVIGNDHLGHGGSAGENGTKGFWKMKHSRRFLCSATFITSMYEMGRSARLLLFLMHCDMKWARNCSNG